MRKAIGMCIVVAIVTIQAIPLMAAEWQFSGSLRFLTQYTKTEAEATRSGTDEEELTWQLQNNSRLNAKFWSGDRTNVRAGDTYARVQFGKDNSDNVVFRLLYGEWYFHPKGKLTIGQHYGPINYFLSRSVAFGDRNLISTGGVYTGRNPLLRLRFGTFPNTFDVALVRPSTSTRRLGAPFSFTTDQTMPRLEVGWGHTFGPLWVDIGAGYNTFEINNTATGNKTRIDSYAIIAALTYELGPFFFNSNVYVGRNLGNYGFFISGDSFAHWNTDTNSLAETDNYGFIAVAGYRYTDRLRVEVGYGYAANDASFPANAQTDDVQSYYLQAVIPLASQVFIVPEVGKIDYGQDSAGANQGAETYAAIKWQIFF